MLGWTGLFVVLKHRTKCSNPSRHIAGGKPTSYYRTLRAFDFPIISARVLRTYGTRKGDHNALPW
jgi:hypothetical protein